MERIDSHRGGSPRRAHSTPPIGALGRWAPVWALALTACGTEVIVHNIDEREANKIVELLAHRDIPTTKAMVDTGRTVSYSIVVAQKSRIEAIELLNHHELPRRADVGYLEVFRDSGLIPTAAEEKAKQLAALEGEIEKQLRLVDGILDVQVQLVIPEDNALRTVQETRPPTTASCTIKYLPGAGGAKPLSEPQVQAVVAAGVERLTPDAVVVIMTPSGARTTPGERDYGDARGGVGAVSAKAARAIALAMVAVILALCGLLVYAQLKVRLWRNRTAALQDTFAQMKRKKAPPPGDMLPPGPEG